MSQVWYCPRCQFGPINPHIDAACPNCGWYPGQSSRTDELAPIQMPEGWYCERCGYGPHIPAIDVGCATCGHIPRRAHKAHEELTPVQTPEIWYCPSCSFGPLNPMIDAACPNCGYIPNHRRTPGQDGAEIVGKVEKLMPLQGEHGFAE